MNYPTDDINYTYPVTTDPSDFATPFFIESQYYDDMEELQSSYYYLPLRGYHSNNFNPYICPASSDPATVEETLELYEVDCSIMSYLESYTPPLDEYDVDDDESADFPPDSDDGEPLASSSPPPVTTPPTADEISGESDGGEAAS